MVIPRFSNCLMKPLLHRNSYSNNNGGENKRPIYVHNKRGSKGSNKVTGNHSVAK